MSIEIRPASTGDEDRIVELSLAAWAPVFASMESILGGAIFRRLFGDDWREYQATDVRRACGAYVVSVATVDGAVAGFTAVDLPDGEPHGEIYMLAVDPGRQGLGLGSRLTEHAVDQIRAAGRGLAVVGTGGDPGHAAARATYERAGFVGMPSVQYHLLLDDAGA